MWGWIGFLGNVLEEKLIVFLQKIRRDTSKEFCTKDYSLLIVHQLGGRYYYYLLLDRHFQFVQQLGLLIGNRNKTSKTSASKKD
jgi:hypothetical protein